VTRARGDRRSRRSAPAASKRQCRRARPATPRRLHQRHPVYPWTKARSIRSMPPGQITDIALKPGEQPVGAGPVAAGDTARWIIGDTESGSARPARPYPGEADARRHHHQPRHQHRPPHLHVELRATAATYMASVSWPIRRTAHRAARQQRQAPFPPRRSSRPISPRSTSATDRRRSPPWRPVRVFDDGRQVFIEFPRGIVQGEMPPLFVIGRTATPSSSTTASGRYMIVDRLFAAAELRLGDRRRQQTRPDRPHRREAAS
jgi:type IV secretory pathway VirB9-like protein